jgi:hypothetical protein
MMPLFPLRLKGTVSGCQTGAAAAREISMEQEESLQQLVKWCKHRHIVQRDLAYDEADTVRNLIWIALLSL